jgi:uncharacterized membrane protein
MIRSTVMDRGEAMSNGMICRGESVSRVEALSDAVLGFAITLLIVSLEVPRTFGELMIVVKGFPVFAICFALLIQIWYKHYIFFRRYGLEDYGTIILNGVLLFVILFYVYPLKFLFSSALGAGAVVTPTEARTLFTLFGVGYAAVYGVLAIMHANALRQRAGLGLSPLELFETHRSIVENLLYIAVAALSIALAHLLPPRWVGFAGWTYALLGVVGFCVGYYGGLRRRKYESDGAPDPA